MRSSQSYRVFTGGFTSILSQIAFEVTSSYYRLNTGFARVPKPFGLKTTTVLSRRQFLQTGCVLAAASGVTSAWGSARPGAPPRWNGYRALVCIVLGGGADSFNFLLPGDVAAFRHYRERRGRLALRQEELIPLRQLDAEGRPFALNGGLGDLEALIARGEATWLANVGVVGGRRGAFETAGLPELSHSKFTARWQTGTDDPLADTGWAGRAADVLVNGGLEQAWSVNLSVSGGNPMQLGHGTMPADLCQSLYRPVPGLPASVDSAWLNERLADDAIRSGRPGAARQRSLGISRNQSRCRAVMEKTLVGAAPLNSRFANERFSQDLQLVARIIAARDDLGARRQIFYVHFDGWDHHHNLREAQAILLPMLGRGLSAFRDALVEMDVFDDVTTFTVSEFGRALDASGCGADHGWGGHHMVMGGAVRADRIHGSYPSLANGGSAHIGAGSFIPTTSMDEYLAGMAFWLGVPARDLPWVFPRLVRFPGVGSSRIAGGILRGALQGVDGT